MREKFFIRMGSQLFLLFSFGKSVKFSRFAECSWHESSTIPARQASLGMPFPCWAEIASKKWLSPDCWEPSTEMGKVEGEAGVVELIQVNHWSYNNPWEWRWKAGFKRGSLVKTGTRLTWGDVLAKNGDIKEVSWQLSSLTLLHKYRGGFGWLAS